ncbi:MAG: HAMP domain-containing histidine kinase, partial [Methylobacterium sp.]|nr:HAMP domain-containing histidine kinase [Methylobacterium sp.]
MTRTPAPAASQAAAPAERPSGSLPAWQWSKPYTRSSSFFVAVISTAILAAGCAMIGYFLYLFSQTDFSRETGRAIETDLANFREWHAILGTGRLSGMIAERIHHAPDQYYLLVDAGGRKLAGNLEAMPPGAAGQAGLFRFSLTPPGAPEIGVLAAVQQLDSGDRLLAGRNIHALESTRHHLLLLGKLCLGALVLVIVGNFIISVFLVRQVNHIAAIAADIIDTGDLSHRIAPSTRWDDLGYLIRILNRMLSHIEQLVNGVRQVSDNIAHDLRTPLTRLQHRIESLPRDRPVSEAEQHALLKEAQALLMMFNSLLRIAEMEAGNHALEMRETAIDRLVADVVELLEPLAAEKDIRLTTSLAVHSARTDRNLLFQALVNIVENAIKFTPAQGSIHVSVEDRDGSCAIVVADSGPGIADQDKPLVLRRFYRTDASRHSNGFGLGLSLVNAI